MGKQSKMCENLELDELLPHIETSKISHVNFLADWVAESVTYNIYVLTENTKLSDM